MIAVMSLWPLVDSYSLAADIVGQGLIQLSIIIVILITVSLSLGHRQFVLLYSTLLVFNVSWIMYSTGSYKEILQENCPTTTHNNLTVLTYNVWKDNKAQTDIIQLIKVKNVDIIWLQELHSNNYSEIIKHFPNYFHYSNLDNKNSQGFAVLTRFPIVNATTLSSSASTAHLQLKLDSTIINIVGVHLTSPKSQIRLNERNNQIYLLKKYLLGKKLDNLIVSGDFNSAPWRPALVDFSKSLNISSSFGMNNFYTSWPNGVSIFFRVPIDQSFISSNFYIIKSSSVSFSGSDHLPLITELKICINSDNIKNVDNFSN